MQKSIVLALPLALCGLVFAAQAGTSEHGSEQAAAHAKISMTQARRIALKVYPGKIVKQELEHEAGGSGLRYSFDIRSGKNTHEVGVDANTGKLLENSLDNNDAD